MALQVTKTTKSNVDATYARIASVNNRGITNGTPASQFTPQFLVPSVAAIKKTTIAVEFWKDAETRSLAKAKGGQVALQTANYASDEVFADVESAYIFLKTLPDFAGATDLL